LKKAIFKVFVVFVVFVEFAQFRHALWMRLCTLVAAQVKRKARCAALLLL
jgi:hypothetical protein